MASYVFQSGDESSVNTGRQLQLMNCLMKFVSDDMDNDFVQLVKQPQYIALMCVHYLNTIGFKLSIQKFMSYDKVKILKQVWSTNASNPKALELITFICIGYDIYEPIIWNGLLKQMVNLHMAKEIEKVIDTVSFKPALRHIDGLAIAWDYLIRIPLKGVTNKRSADQDAALSRSLFMLQSCPIKSKINLLEIADFCVRMNQRHIAAVLIAFANDEQKPKLLETVRAGLGNEEQAKALRNEMTALQEYGIYPFVIKLALAELDKTY